MDASLLRRARAQFIGVGNLMRMAGDPIFQEELWRPLRRDLAVVSSEIAIASPIALPLDRTFHGRGVVRAPLMALILLAMRQTVAPEPCEATRAEGANPRHMVRYITLPHSMPTILFLLLLRMIWMSNQNANHSHS